MTPAEQIRLDERVLSAASIYVSGLRVGAIKARLSAPPVTLEQVRASLARLREAGLLVPDPATKRWRRP